MGSLLFGILSSLLSAGIAAVLSLAISRAMARRPFANLISIPTDQRVVIVIPDRPLPDPLRSERPIDNAHVTFQDMLAVNYVERVLDLAGVPETQVAVHTVSQFLAGRTEFQNHNLVLICSPKANDVTAEVLPLIERMVPGLRVGFRRDPPEGDQWVLDFGATTIRSPSYSDNGPEYTDYALLLLTSNPCSSRPRRLIVVAGIRGIGTWGAGRCLREEHKDILRRSRGRDFVAVVRVTYANHKLGSYELTEDFAELRLRPADASQMIPTNP